VRDDFCGLCLRQTVVHRTIEVIGHLRDLTGCDQRADSDTAKIRGGYRLEFSPHSGTLASIAQMIAAEREYWS